jgi:hypothetical protein
LFAPRKAKYQKAKGRTTNRSSVKWIINKSKYMKVRGINKATDVVKDSTSIYKKFSISKEILSYG